MSTHHVIPMWLTSISTQSFETIERGSSWGPGDGGSREGGSGTRGKSKRCSQIHSGHLCCTLFILLWLLFCKLLCQTENLEAILSKVVEREEHHVVVVGTNLLKLLFLQGEKMEIVQSCRKRLFPRILSDLEIWLFKTLTPITHFPAQSPDYWNLSSVTSQHIRTFTKLAHLWSIALCTLLPELAKALFIVCISDFDLVCSLTQDSCFAFHIPVCYLFELCLFLCLCP